MRKGSQEKPSIADLLRQWRISRNLTQEEFGKLLKRSKRAITKIPLHYVAECLGVSMAEFMEGPYAAGKSNVAPPAKLDDIKPFNLPESMIMLYMLSDLSQSIQRSSYIGWTLPNRIGVPGQVAVRVDAETLAARFGDLLLVAPYENQAINGERLLVWDTRKGKATVIQAGDLKPSMQVIGLVL